MINNLKTIIFFLLNKSFILNRKKLKETYLPIEFAYTYLLTTFPIRIDSVSVLIARGI